MRGGKVKSDGEAREKELHATSHHQICTPFLLRIRSFDDGLDFGINKALLLTT